MKNIHINIIAVLVLTQVFCACRKFVEVKPPITDLVRSTVFNNDATANAAMMGLYSQLTNNGYANGSSYGISAVGALLADESEAISSASFANEFYTNSLTARNLYIGNYYWDAAYQQILFANTILEGVESSASISIPLKNRLTGEALFIRAFAHFYLVNLFGDVPLITTSDYRLNAVAPRTPASKVYEQIVADLKKAEDLLNQNYLASDGTTISTERGRLNKAAASAMLARVFLFTKDWANAETYASKVIANPLYELIDLNAVFLKNSQEAIWQLSRDDQNAAEATTFTMISTDQTSVLSPQFVEEFDATDRRVTHWIGQTTLGGKLYRYAAKYKAARNNNPIVEYSMVLRLAEQYLIRAEARIQQNKLADGIADLNIVRNRARPAPSATDPNPLPAYSLSLNKADAILAVEKERSYELFTEWGHRWLDLKRLDLANSRLGVLKGNYWQPTDQLFPIPNSQIINDPAMNNAQNPGYN